MLVTEKKQNAARIIVESPKELRELSLQQGGGSPYWYFSAILADAAGRYRFFLLDANGQNLACTKMVVPSKSATSQTPPNSEIWPVRQSWSRATENLYSAWLEKLFDAKVGEQVGWTPLHQVTRDASRNFLYNHWRGGEDGPDEKKAIVLKPDCADLPYFLRGYFAWKMQLPFAYRRCDRGNSRRPTKCGELRTNLSTVIDDADPVRRFGRYIRSEVGLVHSGSGRTAPDDNNSDLFPVALNRNSLRPGTVYVDPFGHLLVIAKWVPQTTNHGGLLYAVDGHPDLSVGRKRFWRGAFLFSDNIVGGAGGFKAFRPLVVQGSKIEAMTNEEISKSADYGNFSDEQYKLGLDGFYERLDQIITPQPLSPQQAYRELLEALEELIKERIGSVQVGDDYLRQNNYPVIEMPPGPKIFETKGLWEDYSTPARDIRLLMAIDEVLNFPAKVAQRPHRYALDKKQSLSEVQADLQKLFSQYTTEHKFSYQRSDQSNLTMSMAELINRRSALEMAYNPNDCNEIRWGASGDELKTCQRHAPVEQQELMKKFREWFAKRERPPLR